MKTWIKLNELLQPKTLVEEAKIDKFTEVVEKMSEDSEFMTKETAEIIKQKRKELGI